MGEKKGNKSQDHEAQWHAVYTKSRCEKKVVALMEEQGIVCYCPIQKTVKQYTDRIKKVETVLFKSYVFVNIIKQEQERIRRLPHVVNFVYWLKSPAVIQPAEIESIKKYLESDGEVEIESYSPKVSQKMTVASGPFKGQEGIIEKIFKKKVVLYLEQLGFKVTLRLK